MQARCSIIPSANPLKGNYNTTLNFNDNVDLTAPILSRFDLLAVVKDEVDEDYDDALATFVINSHMKNHPQIRKIEDNQENEQISEEQRAKELETRQAYLDQNMLANNRMNQQNPDIIPQQMLKKYLIYAKRYMKPKLSEVDQNKIT